MNLYIIPHKDKFIVYKPLNRLAFIANAAMVNFIAGIIDGDGPSTANDYDILTFLNSTGFFSQPPVSTIQTNQTEYRPTIAVLCLTNACNLRCIYCFANGGELKRKELPIESGFHAIDLVYRNAVELQQDSFSVSFHGGGEPTLPFKKLQKLVHYAKCKQLSCDVELTSNGYWTSGKTDWILKYIDRLTISFDGIEEVQNIQRPSSIGGKSYSKVMHTIQKIDKRQIPYGIRLTTTDHSIHKLPENIDFLCKSTNCLTFQVEPAFNEGRAVTNKLGVTNHGKFVNWFLKAYDIAIANNRTLYYSGARPWVITDRFCLAHDKALVITPTGKLTSCYEISGEEHPLAGDFHFGGLRNKGEIFINNVIREKFWAKINKRKHKCENCFCYWHCAGDCPAKTFTTKKNGHLMFSERCNVNREITKELILKNIFAGNGIWSG